MSDIESDQITALLSGILQLGRRLRAERGDSPVSLSGIAILSDLCRYGPMPASHLAERERLQPQSLTRIITALESQGCIERRRSAADRRELIIAVTDRGRQALAEDMRGRRIWLDRAIGQTLSAAERKHLTAAARILLKLAHHEADDAGAEDPSS